MQFDALYESSHKFVEVTFRYFKHDAIMLQFHSKNVNFFYRRFKSFLSCSTPVFWGKRIREGKPAEETRPGKQVWDIIKYTWYAIATKRSGVNGLQTVGRPHSIVEARERKEWVEKRRLRQAITGTDTTHAYRWHIRVDYERISESTVFIADTMLSA